MNYDGESTKYSAFALVAIESVWPNPDGNELAPDDYDLSLLEVEGQSSAGKVKNQFSPQLSDLQGIQTERDYYDTRGYYKLIPLNVVAAKTTSGTNGSSFDITFTLDDMLLVTKEDYLNATGLPVSAGELVESDLRGRVPADFLSEFRDASDTRWEYKKDTELGLARYKIDGASSSFNIEDLVDSNDTVTIWFYHDPSDFYSKDADSFVDDESLRLNQDIKHIVGSSDRRNQFSVAQQTFEETLLGNLGLLNEFVAESIREVIDIQTGDEESQTPKVTRDNYESILITLVDEGTTGTLGTDEPTRLREFMRIVMDNGQLGDTVYRDFIKYFYDPRINYGPTRAEQYETIELDIDRGEEITSTQSVDFSTSKLDNFLVSGDVDEDTGESAVTLRVTRAGRNKIMSILNKLPEHPQEMLYDQSSTSDELEQLVSLLNVPTFNTTTPEKFVLAANLLANRLNEMTATYAREYRQKRTTTSVQQNFSNGRTVLVGPDHGETPYLALKGHITSVAVKVGAAQGAHLVTISGSGYEKVLGDNEIYYEDVFLPGSTISAQIDFNTIYVNMTPARAISNIINRWAAKQVLLGKPTNYTVAAQNRFFQLATALSKDVDTVEEAEEAEEDIERLKESIFGQNEIPIRGNFIFSGFTTDPTPNDIRLFSPLNYLDTSRIVEMIRSINESFESPDTEAVINTAIGLDTRKPIMESIRKIGGTAQFYELFVDESGRVRYRLSFEAWERTPQPEYTPTIQDRDLLADGATFSKSDEQVATMVDVRPIRGQYSTNVMDIGWIGRSVPEKGRLPLQNLGRLNEYTESLSPELFRYGLRGIKVDDVYTPEVGGATKKAILYRLFYETPVKQANLTTKLNTAYRPGETVLVSLQRSKHRSRVPINISATLGWLRKLKDGAGTDWGRKVLKSYIGVDNRLRNSDSYALTRSYNLIPDDNLYQKYQEDPYMFVLDQFITTFEFLDSSLGSINIITPEYFPNSYWFFRKLTGRFYSWNENRLKDEQIIRLYENLLVASVQGSKSAADSINELVMSNQGIINAIKFQNFRAASYYIRGVSHNFQYGSSATTSLSLDYGQDTLVLLEPKHSLPIGFLSLEKNMRIGYDNDIQAQLWLEDTIGNTDSDSSFSALQRMYINQLEEDRSFKSASFLHNASVLRNSSIYMHEIAERVGLDYGITITTEQSPSGSRGVVTTPNPATGVPEFASGANDSRAISYRVANELGVQNEVWIEEAAENASTEREIRSYLQNLVDSESRGR